MLQAFEMARMDCFHGWNFPYHFTLKLLHFAFGTGPHMQVTNRTCGKLQDIYVLMTRRITAQMDGSM